MNCKDAITGEIFNGIVAGSLNEKRLFRARHEGSEDKLFFGPVDNKEAQLQRYFRWKTAETAKPRKTTKTVGRRRRENMEIFGDTEFPF